MPRPFFFAALAVLLSGCFLFKPTSSTAPTTSSEPGAAPSGDGFAAQPEMGSPAAPSSDPASATAAPAGPVSVTLRNSCKETVNVFFGDKPKFGSGRYSTMSSNSSTSSSFTAGDMFWIVDGSQNGISSVTVEQGMREIEIVDGCTTLRTK